MTVATKYEIGDKIIVGGVREDHNQRTPLLVREKANRTLLSWR